jgi:CubicO group peptidase (beta-lactamase class C family)
MVELVSGERMDDYMREHIFQPLGLKNITMYPNRSMQERIVKMNMRSQDGTLNETEHYMPAATVLKTKSEKDEDFQNGAAGCFAQPTDCCGTCFFGYTVLT